jgi:hypothetical protein
MKKLNQYKKSSLLLAAIVLVGIAVGGYFIFISKDNDSLPQCVWGPTDQIVNEPCQNYSGGGP